MKQISFVVPCYNSEEYMEHCIESLLLGGEDVEIIIINDGSKDKTGKIADKYTKKYPKIVKVHHQENGGHGEGINQGLKLATGRYFKVVDSDDWADPKAYKELLKKIKKIDSDCIIMNYVYTYTDGRTDQVIDFSNVFPSDRECTWDELKRFKSYQYLSLHSMMYKKEVLDKTKIELPKHCFYEDNLFIYLPMFNTKTFYYMPVDFYRYFIGRADQSVQEPQLIARSSHQRLVSELVLGAYDLDEVKNKKQYKNMLRECIFMATIAVVFTRMGKSKESERQYKEFWANVKKSNPKLYKKVRHFTLAGFSSIPGFLGRAIMIAGFRFSHMLVKFN